jgi:hypothetical protein
LVVEFVVVELWLILTAKGCSTVIVTLSDVQEFAVVRVISSIAKSFPSKE